MGLFLPSAGRDLLHQGPSHRERQYRWGASVPYDWPRFFVRLALDSVANVGSEDMMRPTVNTRF